MIVIASHNNIECLARILKSLSKADTNGHRICVVDTNSTSDAYRDFVDHLKDQYPSIIFLRSNYDCYDSGAYLLAYRSFDDDTFIFLQDSVTISNKSFIPDVDTLLKEYDVVPFINFPFYFEGKEQKRWGEQGVIPWHLKWLPLNTHKQGFVINKYPKEAFFGPMFGVTKSALDKIPARWHVEPTTKVQACAMERRWALLFHYTGASIQVYEYVPHDRWNDFWNMHPDFRQNIQKAWMSRD